MGKLEDMAAFVKIVEAGSLTAAASQLQVAKSAVSRRLAELEHRLGTQLIQRTTRNSSLTETGRAYYEQAQEILANVEELDLSVTNKTPELAGQLKIALPLSCAALNLTSIIGAFAQMHPQVTMELRLGDWHTNLIDEGFDLAIRISDLKDSSLIARKLATIRHEICASPAYTREFGVPEHPNDLRNHRALKYSNASRSQWHLIGPGKSRSSVAVPTKLRANNGEILCELAIAGKGIALLPTFLTWRYVQDGRLVRLLPEYAPDDLSAYVIYPRARQRSPLIRAFTEFLLKEYTAGFG